MPTIKGRIIRILDPRTIIINLGARDGVYKGLKISILGEPEPVVDPFTDDILGEVVIVKDHVEASQVEERFTIARKPEFYYTYKVAKNPIPMLLGMTESEERHQHEPLNIKQSDAVPWIALSNGAVKIGDEVTIALEDREKTQPFLTAVKMDDSIDGEFNDEIGEEAI